MAPDERNIVLKGVLLALEISASQAVRPRLLFRVLEDRTLGGPILNSVVIEDITPGFFGVPRVAATNYHVRVRKTDPRFAYTPAGAWAIFAKEQEQEAKAAQERAQRALKNLAMAEEALAKLGKDL